MTNQTKFCYHCGAHHPVEEMRQIETRAGKRWRCIRSIKATQKTALRVTPSVAKFRP
jgi:hypothetical protein